MGANVAKPEAPAKPKVAGESSHSQATGTNQNYSAQADRTSDLLVHILQYLNLILLILQ